MVSYTAVIFHAGAHRLTPTVDQIGRVCIPFKSRLSNHDANEAKTFATMCCMETDTLFTRSKKGRQNTKKTAGFFSNIILLFPPHAFSCLFLKQTDTFLHVDGQILWLRLILTLHDSKEN